MSYEPTHPGEAITVKWIFDELQRIAAEMQKPEVLEMEVQYAEPARPVEGMVVFADGTSWNPGSGAGTYERRSGAWVKL